MPRRLAPLAGLATTLALGLGLSLVPVATTAASAQDDTDGTVTMSGTAYEFNRVRTTLAGATIHVVQDPDLTTTVAEDGTYSLQVPDGAEITPYITAEGYGTIHLQTFTTDGQDLVNVNFQTPTVGIMGLLAGILKIERDEEGYPAQCAVVSTVSTKHVRGVSYEQFISWGAHGVAGVTASISPEAGTRTYFNEHVIPDASVTETSIDGGVAWAEVPAGRYTLSAQGAGSQWPQVQVDCADGRIVNANPPWGLNQLATKAPMKAKPTWKKAGKRAKSKHPRLAGLQVGRTPVQMLPDYALEHDEGIEQRYEGTITVSCAGKGCFEPRSTSGSLTGPVDLMPLLGKAAKRLKPGRTLSVTLAVPGYSTRTDSWRVKAKGKPERTRTCVPLGESRAQAC